VRCRRAVAAVGNPNGADGERGQAQLLMKLQDALQTSLNELRMQMLGVQVLFGFQFQGLFQEAFANVPASARVADALGLGLLVATLGLSVAIPCQHRLVESGTTQDLPHLTALRELRSATARRCARVLRVRGDGRAARRTRGCVVCAFDVPCRVRRLVYSRVRVAPVLDIACRGESNGKWRDAFAH
jgi:hypothetical protein